MRRELEALGKRPSATVELHRGRLGQRIFGAEVIPPERLPTLAPPGGTAILVSVSGIDPRSQIRVALATMGYVERRDFIVCA